MATPQRKKVTRTHPSSIQHHAAIVGGQKPAVIVSRTLRSGQHVRYDGSVVVLGDVHAGAEIVATGDVLVMGTLRGLAHAGAGGDEAAIVVAFRLDPVQVRIGARISRPPDGGGEGPHVPEIARVRDGIVVIEQYLSATGRNLLQFGEA